MKKIIVLLGFSLFAFAGTVSAGEGCNYGPDGKHAASPVVEGDTLSDPELLALLKKKEAEAKELAQPVFN